MSAATAAGEEHGRLVGRGCRRCRRAPARRRAPSARRCRRRRRRAGVSPRARPPPASAASAMAGTAGATWAAACRCPRGGAQGFRPAEGPGARRPGGAALRCAVWPIAIPSGAEDAQTAAACPSPPRFLSAGPLRYRRAWSSSSESTEAERAAGRRSPTATAACSAAATAGPPTSGATPTARRASIVAAADAALVAAGGGVGSRRAHAPSSASPAPTCPRRPAGLAGRLPFATRPDRDRRARRAEGRARRRGRDHRHARHRFGLRRAARRRGADRSAAGASSSATRAAARAMGRALLAAALLAHDGLGEPTPLLAAVLAEHGGPEGDRRLRPAGGAGGLRPRGAADARGRGGGDATAGRRSSAAAGCGDRGGDRPAEADGPLPVCFLGGLGPEFAPAARGALCRADPRAARHRPRRRARWRAARGLA